ncbi:MAG: hypothetical protein WAQ98_21435 [Blastocatellia bacterium]
MEKYKTNDKQTKESVITPDPQIKALLGMIKTPEPSDEIRLNVMRIAKEKLQKRPLRQKLIGKVKLYFTKRRLGIEINTSEKLTVYSMVFITVFLIATSSGAAYYQFFQPLTVNNDSSSNPVNNLMPSNSTNYVNKDVNNTNKQPFLSNSKDNIAPNSVSNTINNQSTKTVKPIRETKLPTQQATKQSPPTFTLPEDLTPNEETKTYLETIEKDSLAQNNLPMIENPGHPDSITRSKTDTSSTIPKTTTTNEINETADLASMKTIYVKDLGIDDWSVTLRNEIIVAIEKSNQWQFAEKENADVAFRLNKKGELLLVNREGAILWLNSNLTNEKLAPKKAAQQILKEVKEATKNFASKFIKK